jgi:hypothetical protein
MKRGAAALALALLLAGCGSQNASKQRMDDKFDSLDYTLATVYETNGSMYDHTGLERMTHDYISLVRRYADQLGPEEARRRLLAKGDEIAPFCLPCAGTLRDEASRY